VRHAHAGYTQAHTPARRGGIQIPMLDPQPDAR
jgi:hypothetical protein